MLLLRGVLVLAPSTLDDLENGEISLGKQPII